MGGTLAGGFPSDSQLPRGFQPQQVAPPAAQKLTSPMRYMDDDGTWGEPSSPPRESSWPRFGAELDSHGGSCSSPGDSAPFLPGASFASEANLRSAPVKDSFVSVAPQRSSSAGQRQSAMAAAAGSGGAPPRGTPGLSATMSVGNKDAALSCLGEELDSRRAAWDFGSVLEAYSASTGRWYPAVMMQSRPCPEGQSEDIITVQFWVEDDAKQKDVYRSDAQLAPFGSHTVGELPPGFQTRPSQSRQGQLVYFDATTGVKYGSAELAWSMHFDRLFQQPTVGCATVCARPNQSAASPNAVSLAELRSGGPAALAALGGAKGGYGPRDAGPSSEMDFPAPGKVGLPCFGDALGSQAAYLSYEGKVGANEAAAKANGAAAKAAPPIAVVLPPNMAEYPAPAPSSCLGCAPRRPPPPPRNSALQMWQEDPFSQWRK